MHADASLIRVRVHTVVESYRRRFLTLIPTMTEKFGGVHVPLSNLIG